MTVDYGDLGVQEALLVLVDLDAGVEERTIERARGVVLQEVLGLALQQQHDAHATRRRRHQSAPEAAAAVAARSPPIFVL